MQFKLHNNPFNNSNFQIFVDFCGLTTVNSKILFAGIQFYVVIKVIVVLYCVPTASKECLVDLV